MLVVNSTISIPHHELDWGFARSSGKGGQNVNKVNSKAVLRFNVLFSPSLPQAVRQRFLTRYQARVTDIGDLVITSDRFRDQPQNIRDCLNKLREMILSVAEAPKPRKKTKPTRASKERRLQTKKRQSDKKRTRQSGGWS